MTSAPSLPTARRSRVASWLRTPTAPRTVHYVILGIAAVLSLVAATRMWFFFDDWAFLVPSLVDPWAPHVGHWSTTPFLLFHAIRDVFGLSSFLPFAIPVTIAHLVLAHLVWRFMLRVGITAWIATAAATVVVFLGAGSENILWAFQVGFIGAMALALAVALLLDAERLTPLRVAAIVVLALVAPTFSGTALPLLLVAALIGWRRHGLWRTAAMLAPAALTYLAWYLIEGRLAPPAGRAEGLSDIVTIVPVFGLRMLTDGFGRAFPVEILGPLFFAAIAIWGVLSWGGAARREKSAYLLFLAAPIFALVTGYSRANLGLDTAESSRYLYFVIPVMLPLLALGLDKARLRWNLRMAPVLALIGVLALFNAGELVGPLITRATASHDTERGLSAALAVIDQDTDSDIAPDARAYPKWAPDVSVTDLEEMHDEGWFQPIDYTQSDYLAAVLALEVHVSTGTATDGAGCVVLVPGGEPFEVSGSAPVTLNGATSALLTIEGGGVSTEPRFQPLTQPATAISVDAPSGSRLLIRADASDVTVCR